MKGSVAQKIKELRQKRGLTLEQVATVVGVGKSTVRKWETGMIANMKRDKIAALAKALGTTPAYLMGWEEENKKEKGEKMKETNYGLTDEQVEAEIDRLNASEAVALARREARLRYRRRQYLYQLRDLEKKGKALLAAGITREVLDAQYECNEEN